MRYFMTEIAARPVVMGDEAVQWDQLGIFAGMLLGVLATEDDATAGAILATPGAREIDQTEYEALTQKKTPDRSPVSKPSQPAPVVPPPFATLAEDGRVGHVPSAVPQPVQAEPILPGMKTPSEYLKIQKVESPDILPKPATKRGKKSS